MRRHPVLRDPPTPASPRPGEPASSEDVDALRDLADVVEGDIAFVIAERERVRDEELARLQFTRDLLEDQIAEVAQAQLVEELACFKDVLALYRTARRARR